VRGERADFAKLTPAGCAYGSRWTIWCRRLRAEVRLSRPAAEPFASTRRDTFRRGVGLVMRLRGFARSRHCPEPTSAGHATMRPMRPARSSAASVPPAGDGPLVVVASFISRLDADLAVSMLVANGLRACTFADDCGGVDPGLGFATRARVLVPETQAKLALALMQSS
jgi:hypothetical protein